MKSTPPADTCDQGVPTTPYEFIANDPNNYIHEHLTTLYFICKEFNVDTVLEIGTGLGHSTLTFAQAGCKVNSIDIDECERARELILSEGYGDRVTCEQEDSLEYKPIMASYDLIFIDGLHTYQQVKKELEKYTKFIYNGGFLILHDYTNFAHPGVQRACDEFGAVHREYKIYRWFNCNGLYVMKKDETIHSS